MLYVLQTLLAPHSTLLVNLWSYGSAFGHLTFFAPVWITFTDGKLSLNLALSKLWRKNLMFFFLGCLTCSRFPSAFQCVFLEVSICMNFHDLSSNRWFAIFTIAIIPFSFFGQLSSSRIGRWTLLLWVDKRTVLSHMTFFFHEVYVMWRMPIITHSIMTTIPLLKLKYGRRSYFPEGLFPIFWHTALQKNFLWELDFLIFVLWPFLSLPGLFFLKKKKTSTIWARAFWCARAAIFACSFCSYRRVTLPTDTCTELIATFRVARLTLRTRNLWSVSRPTETRVTFVLPECKEPKKL